MQAGRSSFSDRRNVAGRAGQVRHVTRLQQEVFKEQVAELFRYRGHERHHVIPRIALQFVRASALSLPPLHDMTTGVGLGSSPPICPAPFSPIKAAGSQLCPSSGDATGSRTTTIPWLDSTAGDCVTQVTRSNGRRRRTPSQERPDRTCRDGLVSLMMAPCSTGAPAL